MSEENKHSKAKTIALYLGPILAVLVGLFLRSRGWSFEAQVVGGTTALCAVWWMVEPIPIPVTSLIPLAVFPLTGALTKGQVAGAYGHWLILLLMGGFIISQAMEKSGTHKRLAFAMIKTFGGRGKRLVFGFMAASAVLSMWISNTATTLMLLPIALAVISQSEDEELTIPLLLGICYAASIGGMGTPIGTAPNLAFVNEYEKITDKSIDFISWMKIAFPVVLILLPVAGFLITRKMKSDNEVKLPHSGHWRQEEIRTLVVFTIIALAWVFRKTPNGGWSQNFGFPNASDADVALLGVVLLFLVPNGEGKGEKLLDWQSAVKIPWGILLLFGGGLTIAAGFKEVGLSEAVGKQLATLVEFHPYLLILIICISVTFLTEVTSNTASTLLLLPILGETALASELIKDPAVIMIPATISASCAFMLPVATPPNAIIFGSGKISIKQMSREGVLLNFVAAFIISTFFYFMYY